MSDPLSVTASIASLAVTGFALAKGLGRIADGLGAAGREVRLYANETLAFARLLHRVREELCRLADVPADTMTLLRDVVDVCERVLAALDRVHVTLEPLLERFARSPRKLIQLGLRLRWVFGKKAEMLFYRDALAAQHRLLDTVLDVMILQATRKREKEHFE